MNDKLASPYEGRFTAQLQLSRAKNEVRLTAYRAKSLARGDAFQTIPKVVNGGEANTVFRAEFEFFPNAAHVRIHGSGLHLG